MAWHNLGWRPLAFSEIEPFPRAVLQHHYPDVPLHGDFTVLRDQPWIVDADVLVGGTPCQAFSVAGLRNSLSDERGNLSLEFVRLADAIDTLRSGRGREPGIIVWENVPGVLSVKDNAFGCFLAALAGESTPLVPPRGKWTNAGVVDGPQRRIAWRTLDAQFFGLAQRRRRVFVVASAREGFDPAAVLLEFEGVRRDTPPRRETRETTTHSIAPSLTSSGREVERGGDTRGQDPVVAVMEDPVPPLMARSSRGGAQTLSPGYHTDGHMVAVTAARMVAFGEYADDGTASTLKSRDYKDATDLVTHTLRAEGFDASEDGTGRGTPLVPVAYRTTGNDGVYETGDLVHALTTATDPNSHVLTQPTAYAFQPRIARNGRGDMGDLVNALNAQSGETGKGDAAPCVAVSKPMDPYLGGEVTIAIDASYAKGCGGTSVAERPVVEHNMAVRRLTPVECERLQGFPDGWTNIPWRGKPEAPDGPRYKSLGNSMAVPCMAFIGERIARHLRGEL